MKKLFVGKLSFNTNEESLRSFFSAYEPLLSVKIINDDFTGKSRGFGFVEIEDTVQADQAIQTLNGATLDGERILVNEARSDSKRSSGRSKQNYKEHSGSRNSNRGSSSGRYR